MKKYLKQLKANKKGFTLIEMIVVIAIIGILAAILVPSMAGYLNKAKESKNTANAKMVYTAAQAAVTSLEATNPVVGAENGKEYKKTVDTVNTDGKRKDLFDEIEKLIAASNYGKFADISVIIDKDGAVKSVAVTEKTGDTPIPYPK